MELRRASNTKTESYKVASDNPDFSAYCVIYSETENNALMPHFGMWCYSSDKTIKIQGVRRGKKDLFFLEADYRAGRLQRLTYRRSTTLPEDLESKLNDLPKHVKLLVDRALSESNASMIQYLSR